MSVARIGAVAAVAVAILLTALLMLGVGSSGYRVRATFENAGQLIEGNQVQVGGKSVGKITAIKLTDDNRAEIDMEIDDEFAPLREGATATIRMAGLVGVANRYISINPGPDNAPKIPDGGTLGQDKTTAVVDVDQLLNAIDADTRVGIRRLIQQFGAAYVGNAESASKTYKYFGPFLGSASRVFDELTADQEAFRGLVVNSSRLLTALAARRGDLSQLVHNGAVATRAIGQEDRALAEALGLLPPTLRQANTTFVNLRSALDDLEPLIRDLRPTLPSLKPYLKDLRKLLVEGGPTIRDLRYTLRKKGEVNDFTELARMLPSIQEEAGPSIENTIKGLRDGTPIIEFWRPYAPEITGFAEAFAGGAANYDANGHYLRAVPLFFNFQANGGQYEVASSADRATQLQKDVVRRCPGAASQPATDGSSPFRDGAGFDCDPSLAPPGP